MFNHDWLALGPVRASTACRHALSGIDAPSQQLSSTGRASCLTWPCQQQENPPIITSFCCSALLCSAFPLFLSHARTHTHTSAHILTLAHTHVLTPAHTRAHSHLVCKLKHLFCCINICSHAEVAALAGHELQAALCHGVLGMLCALLVCQPAGTSDLSRWC